MIIYNLLSMGTCFPKSKCADLGRSLRTGASTTCLQTRSASTGRPALSQSRALDFAVACGIFPGQESNYVPCISRWICIHCATKEVLEQNLNIRSQGSVCTLSQGRGSHQSSCTSSKLLWWLRGKELACQRRRHRFNPWVRRIPWRRKWQPTPVFLPGKSHGQRSLAGYGPWDCKESDMI